MKEINPETSPQPLSNAARAEISALAARQIKANGVLMQIVTFVGGQVEDGMKMLPRTARTRLETAAAKALRTSFDAAGRSRTGLGDKLSGDKAHRRIASLSGAVGGLGGLPTALIEIPIATTIIFRAVQEIAAQNGEDPTTEHTRAQCLQVFGSGSADDKDDGVDTSFIGARLGLTGPAINRLISQIAPKFASVLGQKLASQTVPILGAMAGAGTNYTFTKYYIDIAHVHFGLRRLARSHGTKAVEDHFHSELLRLKRPILQAEPQ